MDEVINKALELLETFGIRVIAAIVIFILGRWIAKAFRKLITKMMEKKKVDPLVIGFTSNIAYVTMLVMVIIAALGQLGIETTSFIAILGAAGLAIGLALKGSLSNFAAGFLMVIFRPFNVGDYIEGAGTEGVVEEIQIFNTILSTPDNKTVIIPNANLTGDNITNWSLKGTRRVDMVFGIGYEDNIDQARQLMKEILSKDDRILKDPPPKIAVKELADNSVNFVVRPWVKSDDYWDVYMDAMEKIKKAFDTAGISIPYPQRDVHVYEQKAA